MMYFKWKKIIIKDSIWKKKYFNDNICFFSPKFRCQWWNLKLYEVFFEDGWKTLKFSRKNNEIFMEKHWKHRRINIRPSKKI